MLQFVSSRLIPSKSFRSEPHYRDHLGAHWTFIGLWDLYVFWNDSYQRLDLVRSWCAPCKRCPEHAEEDDPNTSLPVLSWLVLLNGLPYATQSLLRSRYAPNVNILKPVCWDASS